MGKEGYPIWWRAKIREFHGIPPKLDLFRVYLVKENPKSWWGVNGWDYPSFLYYRDRHGLAKAVKRYGKIVYKGALKRYAHPTKEEALESLERRMELALQHSEDRVIKFRVFLGTVRAERRIRRDKVDPDKTG